MSSFETLLLMCQKYITIAVDTGSVPYFKNKQIIHICIITDAHLHLLLLSGFNAEGDDARSLRDPAREYKTSVIKRLCYTFRIGAST